MLQATRHEVAKQNWDYRWQQVPRNGLFMSNKCNIMFISVCVCVCVHARACVCVLVCLYDDIEMSIIIIIIVVVSHFLYQNLKNV